MRLFIFTCISAAILSIGLLPIDAFALTHMTSGSLTLTENVITWEKSGSPYILEENITVPGGATLKIGPGVTVTSATSTDTSGGSSEYIFSLNAEGNLEALGSADDPVIFQNMGQMNITNGEAHLENVRFEHMDGIVAFKSAISIKSGHFSGMQTAVSARGSIINIDGGTITDTDIGIQSKSLVYLVENNSFLTQHDFGIGGVGNAFADEPLVMKKPDQNQIIIRNVHFQRNREYDIYNQTVNVVDARRNWWNDEMPSSSESVFAKTVGFVDVSEPNDPIPLEKPTRKACCSNVLFLPGMQASRLYVDESGIIPGTSTNRLWEPNRNDDVRKLFYTSTNLSGVVDNVYPKDVIDNAFGYGVYGKFIDTMNEEVASGTIREWLPFPYDWRRSVHDVARSDDLYALFSRLASSSPTGKVTIVAHSNGGLLTKEFGKVLEEKGGEALALVDKVVFVAVPQLGTPQAIAALLHGSDQSMLGGFILSPGVARHLGISIPGAYGLIPSASYFKGIDIGGPVSNFAENIISFASGTMAHFDFSKYGANISDYSGMKDFLTASRDKRSRPSEGQVGLPDIIDTNLLSLAEGVHGEIDDWHFSSTTEVYSIVGWGQPTLTGLSYSEKGDCVPGGCVTRLSIAPRHSTFGDGTVVSRSASAYSEGKSLFINLDKKHADAVHSNILESRTALDLISLIMSTSSFISATTSIASPTPQATFLERLYAMPNVSDRIPDEKSEEMNQRNLRIGVHSPVDLHIYDERGNHTGPAKNPIPGSDLGYIERNIPGSSYSVYGEDKYVTLPGAEENYVVNVRGTGDGSFSLETEEFAGDMLVASSSFENIPVVEGASATTTITQKESGLQKEPSAQMTELKLDLDADGKVDSIFSSPSERESSSTTINQPLDASSVEGRPRGRSNALIPAAYVATSSEADHDIKTHIFRLSDLIKKNHLFLKSMSKGDRGSLLDLLNMVW